MKSVSAGQSHSLAIVKEGKVFGWGQAEYGAIGMRIVNDLQPSEIQFDQSGLKITQTSCGSRHSAFLTSKNYNIKL